MYVNVCVCVCVWLMYVSVIGTWFYVMEYVPGRVFTDPRLPGLDNDQRRRVYDSMCEVLANIHRVDISAAGLENFGQSTGQ